jgi:hypothetical protein
LLGRHNALPALGFRDMRSLLYTLEMLYINLEGDWSYIGKAPGVQWELVAKWMKSIMRPCAQLCPFSEERIEVLECHGISEEMPVHIDSQSTKIERKKVGGGGCQKMVRK